jgi:hypothetical protein
LELRRTRLHAADQVNHDRTSLHDRLLLFSEVLTHSCVYVQRNGKKRISDPASDVC